MALGVGLATFGSWQIYIDDVGSGSIVLKKSVDVANQIFSASWKRFRSWDAGGRTAERRRDVGRSKTNYDGNKRRM
jgi:hypothetical protein